MTYRDVQPSRGGDEHPAGPTPPAAEQDGDARPRTERRQKRREADIRLDLAMEVLEGGYWHLDVASSTFETSTHLAQFVAGCDAQPLGLGAYLALILPEDRHHADLLPLVTGRLDRSVAEYRLRTTDGLVRWMRCSRRLVRDEAGAPSRVIGVAVDVTEQKRLQASIEQQARTDALTGLANRRGFEERTAASLARLRASRRPCGFGLLMLDLDRFKPINDRHGHLTGDGVLQTLATRLLAAVRPIDLAARLGGDEFAVLVDDADEEALTSLAERLVTALAAPMTVNGLVLEVGCSIGIAAARAGDEAIEDVIGRADAALYEAKHAGRRNWRLAA